MPELFETIGLLAIAAGGLLAAFSAGHPSRLASWTSAYLVLVVGLVQFGLAVGWQRLGGPAAGVTVAAFLLYNLGNAAVIGGRILKGRSLQALRLVRLGGALLAISMLALIWSIRHATASWTLAWFLALTIVILVSMPIGLTLSARRR